MGNPPRCVKSFYFRGRRVPTIAAEPLLDFSRRMFEAAGLTAADSHRVALSLVEANLRGHDSHGVIRITQYIGFLREGKLVKDVELTVLKETPAILSVDANWGQRPG